MGENLYFSYDLREECESTLIMLVTETPWEQQEGDGGKELERPAVYEGLITKTGEQERPEHGQLRPRAEVET